MRLDEKTMSVYLVAIVGIVAAVALLLIILNSVDTGTVSGAAVQSTTTSYTEWTTCLDKGNSIKLGNPQGGTLEKKDVCTGTANKLISHAICTQDADGYYTYKFSNPEQCGAGKTCMKDSSGAYCS